MSTFSIEKYAAPTFLDSALMNFLQVRYWDYLQMGTAYCVGLSTTLFLLLVWFYFRGVFDVTLYDPETDWWLMVGYPDPDDPIAVAEWEAQ